MAVRFIDMSDYKRIDHFNYFRTLAYPYVGVTVDVDITKLYLFVKENNYPFFLSFLWCINQACNEVVQFRQRIVEDKIIEYDVCATSHTVAKEDETYAYCTLFANKPFKEYLSDATVKHELAKLDGTIEESAEEAQSLIFISTLPWLNYSSLIQPVPIPADSNPRITWGKYEIKDDKVVLPVSVLAHHALVDGKHIAEFYRVLERKMEELCK